MLVTYPHFAYFNSACISLWTKNKSVGQFAFNVHSQKFRVPTDDGGYCDVGGEEDLTDNPAYETNREWLVPMESDYAELPGHGGMWFLLGCRFIFCFSKPP